MRAEYRAFADHLSTSEMQSRQASYYWIGGGTLAILILCGAIVWVVFRNQSQRIGELKLLLTNLMICNWNEI